MGWAGMGMDVKGEGGGELGLGGPANSSCFPTQPLHSVTRSTSSSTSPHGTRHLAESLLKMLICLCQWYDVARDGTWRLPHSSSWCPQST